MVTDGYSMTSFQQNHSEQENVVPRNSIAGTVTDILDIAMFTGTLWIISNMTLHGFRCNTWDYKTEKGKVYIVALVSVVISVPRFIVTFYGRFFIMNDSLCEIMNDFGTSMALLAMMATYVFLWCRQLVLRQNEFVKSCLPNRTKHFSYAILPLIRISLSSMGFMSVYPRRYGYTNHTCFVQRMERRELSKYTGLFTFVAFLGMQVSLLVLFVLPMVLVSKQRQRAVDNSHIKRQNDLLSKVKRYIFCSATVVVSDFTPVVFGRLFPSPSPATFHRVAANLDVFINQLCMLATYDPFLPILFAVFHRHRPTTVQSSNASK